MVKAIFIFFGLLFLQGCSVTRLAYENADIFLRWQANSYFDLQDEQSDDLDRTLAGFLAWHRSKELPGYARLAEEAAGRMRRGVMREDLEWSYDAVRAEIREALGAAAAEMAGLLDRLSPAQISHLERRLAEENRKFVKEQVQGSLEERRERRTKRNVDRLAEWFGPLSESQVERVRRYSAGAPFSAEMRDRDRRRRQAEFIAILRAKEAQKKLQGWAQDWEGGREPAYAEASRAIVAQYMDLLLDLDRMLKPAQRAHAADRLQRYAGLFDSLAAAR
ncbi:MAG: DUF6279 family lipoprotein [Burkholderiales bacterium]